MVIVTEPLLSISSEAVAVRHVRAAVWRGRILLLLLWLGGVAAMARLDGSAVCWGPILLLGGTAALIGRQHGAPVVGARARGARGSLTIDAAGVDVEIAGRRLRYARAEIVGGWTESFRDREEVVIETRGGTLIRAAVDDARKAHDVLRAAGVAPDQAPWPSAWAWPRPAGCAPSWCSSPCCSRLVSAALLAATVGLGVHGGEQRGDPRRGDRRHPGVPVLAPRW